MSGSIKFSSPTTVLPPYGAYSHAAVVSAGSRLLFTSGQVGETPDAVIPETVEEQYRVALNNIVCILADNGVSPKNIVKITTYLVSPIAPDKMRKIREDAFGDIAPAATLIFVPKLAGPKYLVEIEAVAALD
ncbi:RidA family protein [Niveispirillum sp. SYP-B3756]|uniref:RidA family protein n=1 Tax=Niveispirillum sp. SYP-B3756 TaxID=2662178 RepID=UPI0015650D60|nr:RidA family protein [Niveispirillum sp. SYP-B3756]